MSVIDETNHKYGHLLVLKREGSKNGKAAWLCQCDCGNLKVCTGDSLRQGTTTSCGCQKVIRGRIVGKSNAIDITNQKFGKLTAIEPVKSTTWGGILWKCQCECGNIHYAELSNLKSGQVKSCGCLKSKGEYNIQKLLTQKNIIFQTQYTPKGFIFNNGYKPYYDFAIFDNEQNLKCLIEYQGEQHYRYRTNTKTWYDEETVSKIQQRDEEKRQLCLKNNVQLYEISYTKFNNLENEITNILFEQNLQNQ